MVEAAVLKQGENNFTGAGIIFKKMAQMCEDAGDLKGTIDAWEAAEGAYAAAGAASTAAQCKLSRVRFDSDKR